MACQERARGRLRQRCFYKLVVGCKKIKRNTRGEGGAVTAPLPTGTCAVQPMKHEILNGHSPKHNFCKNKFKRNFPYLETP